MPVTTSPGAAEPALPTAGSARVGMVGAGQLARMTQQAAVSLGVRLEVLATDPGEPAVLAGAGHRLGAVDDVEDLRALAAGADVVTFDHEGTPPELLAELEAEGVLLAPTAPAQLLAQDKLHGRAVLAAGGFPLPPWIDARSRAEVEAFGAEHGWPLMGKAPRGGYDGRGVFELADADAAEEALRHHPDGLLVEPRLALERELAVLVARTAAGEAVAYPVVESVQRDGMCRELLVPARVPDELAREATELALAIAEAIGSTGILAVELFQTADGLSVNELALRPHNSGHYATEGCETSQFEQHLRAALGWPLGSTALRAPAVVTVNVVGREDGADPMEGVARALAVPGAHVHLYGKGARPGRKLGHVTVCGPDLETAGAAARRAVELLGGAA